ncbi:paraquat-inducible protein A [Rhodobacterales bacterium HKCCE4037]|nr:paraquat-inducible protein A [Rhodobacterales bacterium HKCCE4037]
MHASHARSAISERGRYSSLIGCPVCDALYQMPEDRAGRPTRCRRCGHWLTYGKSTALTWIVSLSVTNVALLVAIVFLPFLELRAGQFDNAVSVIDVVLGFSSGIMVPLALAVLAFILMLPLCRLLLVLYALTPVVLGRQNLPGAERALAWSFLLKPWAMAEIFMLGVAVALVKLADLATISIGAAFWMFVVIVLLNAYQDTLVNRHSLWTALTWQR